MHGTEIDISVIIPAYNSEKWIERAIQSVLKQKDMSWELILVENGSDDGTYEKCCQYAEADDRIKVVQSAKGVSRARNAGMQEVSGEWTCFLDADDYLYENAFSYFSSLLKNNEMEFIVFGHNSGSMQENADKRMRIVRDKEYCALRCEFLENPTQYMPVWGKFFRTEIIRSNQLRFDEELELAEDADFTFRYMRCCCCAAVSEAELYHYSRDVTSTVRTYKKGKDLKYIKSMEKMRQYMENESSEIQRAFYQYVMMHLLLILVHDTYASENPGTETERRSEVKRLLNVQIFKDALSQIRVHDCKKIRMLPILCFKWHLNRIAILAVKYRIKQNNKV